MKAIKNELRDDPVRKARALQGFYARNRMTPMRNLLGLLFLPMMMLGVSAAEIAARATEASFLWYGNLGMPDSTFVLPVLLSLLGAAYLVWIVGKTPRQKLLWGGIGFVAILVLVLQFTAATLIYLNFSMLLLLIQRTWVTGLHRKLLAKLGALSWSMGPQRRHPDVWPLARTDALSRSGNKSLRLSTLRSAGFPIPEGVVIGSQTIAAFKEMSLSERKNFASHIWQLVDRKTCAVRSSASEEDGANHSFAGVFESVLNVDAGNMEEAIQEVINSFSSDRAKSYSGEDAVAHTGNILVQQMVDSEYAGVIFTQDPSAPGRMIVELVEGCGDDLVSGRKSPQSLRFGRVSLTPLDKELPPIDLAPLLALGQRIEELFGRPQDIEWAYAHGAFQIVQSRDVTATASSDPEEMACLTEWKTFFETFQDADPETTKFEQDEMSELLPQPTPLSFSFMGSIWGPGGSVDLAFRELGISYNIPEGRPGHLVNLFGRTYVDVGLKTGMAGRLPKAKAKQLRQLSEQTAAAFPGPHMQSLERDMAFWRAVDFERLPLDQVLESVRKLGNTFVNEVYVEAEKINVLTGLVMAQALAETEGNAEARRQLMNPALPNSPASLIAASLELPASEREGYLFETMGHRAHFDYELSEPRHSESPQLLNDLLEGVETHASRMDTENLTEIVALAVKMQDLKERAKHEALRLIAQMRRAILALGQKTGLEEHVFYLDWDELVRLDEMTPVDALAWAKSRKAHLDIVVQHAPELASLTLRDCERLSGPEPLDMERDAKQLGGTCVAGSKKASGRVFVVDKAARSISEAFNGFEDGDIIVCPMVNPKWLPFIQRSGGVLSEIGGWLSHMAIIAREKDILMLVRCVDLNSLKTGAIIDVGTDGSIESRDP